MSDAQAPAPDAGAPVASAAPAEPASTPDAASDGKGKTGAPADRTGNRLGRSALFVHGLGVAFALLAAVVLAYAGMDYATDDPFALMAVGGGALIVCSIWSVILAVRAVCKRELLLMPGILGLIIWAEVSAGLVALWLADYLSWRTLAMMKTARAIVDWIFWLGLPVLMPVALLALLLAWPLSRLAVRLIEKSRAAKEAEHDAAQPLARRRLDRLAIGGLFLIAMLVLLPVPLTLYAGMTTRNLGNLYKDERFDSDRDWRGGVGGWMPEFVLDASESLCAALPAEWTTRFRFQMLGAGWASADRLEARLNDPSLANRESAFIGLMARDRARAISAFKRLLSDPVYLASGNVYRLLLYTDRDFCMPAIEEIESIVKTGGPAMAWYCTRVVERYLECASNERLRTFCRTSLAGMPNAMRMVLYRCVYTSDDAERIMIVALYGLDDPMAALAERGLEAAAGLLRGGRLPDEATRTAWLKRLKPEFESTDVNFRRGSTETTALLLGLPVGEGQVKEWGRQVRSFGAPPVGPENPAELTFREKVRAAAEKWLKEHGE